MRLDHVRVIQAFSPPVPSPGSAPNTYASPEYDIDLDVRGWVSISRDGRVVCTPIHNVVSFVPAPTQPAKRR